MDVELEVKMPRRAQISFSKKYSEKISLEDFMEEMRYYFNNNYKHLQDNLFSLVFDLDLGMCITVQFDREYFKKHKHKKGKYMIIACSDLEEVEEGL